MKQKISDKTKMGKENKQANPAAVENKPATPEVIQHICLSRIVCNSFNPRKYRTEEDLDELTKSIVNFGIIQPIMLRVKDEKYEIVCGERRYRASLMAERSTIQAIIKEYSDAEAMEICILENLQRRDINPVEEAVSFGKLMEVREYAIEDLVKQFGKTDKYIRSRLQLRNLTDEISRLLVKEEITLSVALELARFCPDIQKDVYEKHLSATDSYSWKHLQAKEFRRLLENGYSADLSNYEFDQSDCKACPFNSSVYDLFADGNCGNCQKIDCLRYKQAEYMATEATKLLSERANTGVCVVPNSFASAEVVGHLSDAGHEIYEMVASRLPVEPQKPEPERFESESDYKMAEASYEASLQQYRSHSEHIETMLEQGKAQLLVDVSRRKPELCYRVVPETESRQAEEGDTVERLRNQDRRNREIAIEKGVEEVKRYVKENAIPAKDFSPREQELLYFIMLSFLRKENYGKFGMNTGQALTDEEKMTLIACRSIEQENAIRRDFIIHGLSQASGNCLRSHLLLEFAAIHFPDKVTQVKMQYNETYKKRHEKIEARIRELEPFNNENTEEAVTVPEEQPAEPRPVPEPVVTEEEETVTPGTFDDPDMDDIPLYPGLPEQARIGEIPEEEEDLPDIIYEEFAD
ncbi:MAG: ParB/RepB/Spo0J family partition protein [Bacteroidales bacterium]|jgi:ParB family chromosome partitioning protein|nr:ParB/RepB/Spo0J family partition protein [Bacteroidales bacterium]